MKNDKLILYKENIFTKISNFFKRLFFRKKEAPVQDSDETPADIMKYREKFVESIEVKQSEEEKRLKDIQLKYDNGEIEEDDISREDMDKLIEIYKKEAEELKADTLKRKEHIAQMLKELKQSS